MTPAPHRFGPFEFDRRTGTVLRQGEPLALGHRAIRLLECLLTRPGEILTKSELMDAAWPDTTVEEANLTVQIAALRRALAMLDGGEWIVTIPRIGYRFVREATATLAQETSNLERPVIAVVPFDNLSHSPELSLLATGLIDEIAVALGKLPGLLVNNPDVQEARESAITVAKQRARAAGASVVLAGSVRQSNGRNRVVVQLLNGASGGQLWAERFEGQADDDFALQDEFRVLLPTLCA